ncbi:unnamed protein product [Moneuplotes crassus]|uniref:Uncharacterized protein n=1 Tax=Euplotes crassus TaxID=5936 RepID=A0AAD1Y6J6_EUPCR|nr:unnamed protein product [Moneuplotes crassus]
MVIRPNKIRYLRKGVKLEGKEFEELLAKAEHIERGQRILMKTSVWVILVVSFLSFAVPAAWVSNRKRSAKSYIDENYDIDQEEEREESKILINTYIEKKSKGDLEEVIDEKDIL